MSGVVGVGLRLAMGAALTVGVNLDSGGGFQDKVDRGEQDTYFREVLPKVASYDPNGSFGFGMDNDLKYNYYSVSLKNLSFVNQDLSRIQYKVLEIRDSAGNDVAAIKNLEELDDFSSEVQLKVKEDASHENLKYARFRLAIEIPAELKRETVPVEEGEHSLGRVNVKIESVMTDSWSETMMVDGQTTVKEHPVTSVSYSHNKSSLNDSQQVYVMGLNNQSYANISGTGDSSVNGVKSYHVTFEGKPSELELIDIVGMELFSYDLVVDLKTGNIMIDR
ncbi:hypothetical protein GCM10023116_36410 [Kistimonas scapharcae]|uniref:Uncharacterized protein n=1 Tax=Kistimonas scapharcae TaxID=1036133 RepID=A0ABP8V639_9GAMM